MGKKLDRLYIRTDALFTRDERYVALPDRAWLRDSAYLFFLALNGWSRDKKTDGHVPAAVARTIGREMSHTPSRTAAIVEALVGVGLLTRDGEELVIPKYAKWQDTREEIERYSAAGRTGGKASASTRKAQRIVNEPSNDSSSDRSTNRQRTVERSGNESSSQTETETETENEPPLPPRKRRGSEPSEYQAFVAELNEATGRHFQGDDESRRKYAQVRHAGRSADDLLAAARGVVKSPHHMGQNDAGVPYNAPINVLRSKMLDQLIGLGRGEIEPGRVANGTGDADEWMRYSTKLGGDLAPGGLA